MRTILTKEDIAFEKGFQAHEQGKRLTDNPYATGTRERSYWTEGWLRAQDCNGDCDA